MSLHRVRCADRQPTIEHRHWLNRIERQDLTCFEIPGKFCSHYFGCGSKNVAGLQGQIGPGHPGNGGRGLCRLVRRLEEQAEASWESLNDGKMEPSIRRRHPASCRARSRPQLKTLAFQARN